MALQKTVSMYPALGVAGQPVTTEQTVYTPFNYLSDGTAKAGSFAFVSSSSVNTGGVAQSFVGATGTASTKPLGLVERILDGYINFDEDGSLIYKEGLPVKVAVQGDYVIEASGVASVGASVFVKPTDGTIAFATAEGLVDTGWVVKTAASAKGDLIVISNHSNN